MEDQFENFSYDRQENSYGQMPHYQDNRPPRRAGRTDFGFLPLPGLTHQPFRLL